MRTRTSLIISFEVGVKQTADIMHGFLIKSAFFVIWKPVNNGCSILLSSSPQYTFQGLVNACNFEMRHRRATIYSYAALLLLAMLFLSSFLQ